MRDTLPVLDIGPLLHANARVPSGVLRLAGEIGAACRDQGFFQVIGHGVDPELTLRLEQLSRDFFARPMDEKLRIRMELGKRAWRGYFPLGSELTSGTPDQKEGIYFGDELGEEHPLVAAGTPLHGRNLFPELSGFRETVLEYMDAVAGVGHALMRGIALSLGLSPSYFHDRYTADPLILFRIFHYPPVPDRAEWGVAEHTDYGLLTILATDATPGLQVKVPTGWIDVPPVPGAFVCNLGDMLDRMTGGLYRSTPHRVRNQSGKGRLSFPLFFDPNFEAPIEPIHPGRKLEGVCEPRWDQADLQAFSGTYGEYLLEKVSLVFPDLGRDVL